MSHFTVLVCVSPVRLAASGGDVNEAVEAMMAPYQENNMGDCPKQFLAFNDEEDEYAENYASDEKHEFIKLASGELCWPWDSRFETGPFGDRKRVYPDDSVKVSLTFRERFATFDTFVSEYHGKAKRDPEKGRFGYWENPNRKWDYYRVGGRWSGHMFVKPGVTPQIGEARWDSPESVPERAADVCRIGGLDWPRIETEMRARADEFWAKYDKLRTVGKLESESGYESIFGARSTAIDMGLCEVVRDADEGKRRGGFRWGDIGKVGDDRADWYDVYDKTLTRDTFIRTWAEHFSPLRTYAALDEDGWHEPGKMGWFACTSSTPETTRDYAQSFHGKFLRDRDPNTVLVVVDCHI